MAIDDVGVIGTRSLACGPQYHDRQQEREKKREKRKTTQKQSIGIDGRKIKRETERGIKFDIHTESK